MLRSRLRLAALWMSQTSRVAADWCLRIMAFGLLLDEGVRASWYLTTAVCIFPSIVLVPVIGLLGNALPRRRVLIGSAAYILLVVACGPFLRLPWLAYLALVALGSAVYSPIRYAILPAAALDARLTLPRVTGGMEMGGAAAIVLGAALGVKTSDESRTIVLLALNILCWLSAIWVAFPSDGIRREPFAQALRGFFSDTGRVLRDREARYCLLALACFHALVITGAAALLTPVPGHESFALASRFRALSLIGVGAAAGCGAAAIQGHPRRCLGLVPIGAAGLLLVLALMATVGYIPDSPWILLGFMGGLAHVPLRAAYLAAVPADTRGNATAMMYAAIYLAATALALPLFAWVSNPAAQLAVLAILATGGTGVAWYFLYGRALEVAVEIALLPIYRIRAYGPGAGRLPARGPLLIVANHAAYLDPFWLAKVAPRQIRPMMTSAFYDLPVVSWLSHHVARAIRVPTGTFRREAPELQEAIAALRHGDCVVIFPEGILRRSEDVLLRPFGRGVWHILHALPDTPVCVCWIEGGWGSYFSYKDGLPCKNKPFDRGRSIKLALAEPHPLDPAVLADHHTTRAWLRQAVLDCRGYLGLAAPAGCNGSVETPAEPGERVPLSDDSSSN